tara:strand:+ start:92627 stop:93346 length:720 start_codon:yes stop_codon:yes gene_type:complete
MASAATFRQWTGALLLGAGFGLSAFHAMAAEPVGDETFEGGFACAPAKSENDKAPVRCRSQINPSLPVFEFLLVWKQSDGGHALERIELREQGKPEPFQVIENIQSDVSSHIANNGFEAIDLNFDGFLDMRVISFLPAGPNTPYQNWLWSPRHHRFVANPALDEISSPQFDADAEEITSAWRSSAVEHGSDIYVYDEGKPVLIHREVDKWSEGGTCERSYFDRIEDDLRKTGTGPCEAE